MKYGVLIRDTKGVSVLECDDFSDALVLLAGFISDETCDTITIYKGVVNNEV